LRPNKNSEVYITLYKTRVVFKIFSNTNILSEILINSEIIRGASQYIKCEGCRGYYGNKINKFGKKTIFIVEMCQNVPEEIRKKGQLVTNEVTPSHIQIITYFYGWWIVLEALGPWCLPDKKLVVPREKLERQRLKMLFFSPLMTTVDV
jgi:hypothetical protein